MEMEQIGQRGEQMVLDDVRMPGEDADVQLQNQSKTGSTQLEMAPTALNPTTGCRVLREVEPEESATWEGGTPIQGY